MNALVQTSVEENAPSSQRPLLEIRDAAVHFESRRFLSPTRVVVRAVDGVDAHLQAGETLGLVGESGCGKTTLARAVMQLLPLKRGRIVLDGMDLGQLSAADLRRARRRFQMVFQDPYASLDPRKNVEVTIREPLDIHGIGDRFERLGRVDELLDLVGLPRHAKSRQPHEFSGGQRQRIGIARALALNPDLVVADEPISALDVSIQAQVTNLLRDLQVRLNLAYLYIAHDLAVVRYISDRVAVMYLGRLVEEGPTERLFDDPLHPYTIALLSAVPIPEPRLERQRKRIVLKGDIPSASSPPAGCRFHTRCWLRQELGSPDECTTVEPQLRSLGGHRVACHFAERLLDSDKTPA